MRAQVLSSKAITAILLSSLFMLAGCSFEASITGKSKTANSETDNGSSGSSLVSINLSSSIINSGNQTSFLASGTCSGEGADIDVLINNVVVDSTTCTGGAWSRALDLSSTSDAGYVLNARITLPGQSPQTSSPVNVDKDSTAPTVILSSSDSSPTNSSSLSISVSFSEAVNGLSPSNFSLTNATALTVIGAAASYTLTISPIAEGPVSVQLSAAGAQDLAGNNNLASNTLNWTYDITPPVATLSGAPSGTNTSTALDVTVGGASLTAYRFKVGDGSIDCTNSSGYSAEAVVATHISSDISGITDGSIKLCVVGRDAAGNFQSFATSTSTTWTKDTTGPSLAGTVSDGSVYASTTSSASLSWATASDTGSGVSHYELAIGTSAGGTQTLAWTNIGNVVSYQRTGLTLTDGTTYYPSIRAVDALGNTSSVIQGDGWLVDVTGPSVTNVTSSTANGAYKVAQTISIQVQFNEVVTVVGNPFLTLETGATDRDATYASGSGSNSLTFSYTVQTGDANNDLDYLSTGALNLNSGTIKDAAGNNATLTLVSPGAAGSLGANKTLVIDTTAPSLTGSVTDGSYLASTSSSTNLSWSAATDGGSGVSYYEVRIETGAGFPVLDWTNIGDFTSYQATGLTLTDGVTYFPYVRAVDVAGNTSSVIQGDGWIVDVTAPNVGSIAFNDGASEWSTTKTPTMTWNAATDSGSGVSYYEIALGTTAGGTDVKTWTSAGAVTTYQITGLTLTRGQAYYASIRAIDNAGNTSAVAQGDGWFVTNEMFTTNGQVNTMVQAGGKLYLGGSFTEVAQWSGGGVPVDATTGIANWPAPTAKARVNGSVLASVPDGSGGFYIGGGFSYVGGVARNNLAHILADGSVSSWDPNVNNRVTALALIGTTLYVGGWFTSVNGGTARNSLASFNTSTGNLNSWAPVLNNWVNTMVTDASNLYIGGWFTDIGGSPRGRLASFSLSTGNLNAWDGNSTSPVNSLAISGTTLYVGGNFMMIGGSLRNNLASFNTSTGALTTWDPGASNIVNCLLVSGTTLYVGGLFSTIASTARVALASFNTSTGALTTWNPNPNTIVSAFALSGSTLYVGGVFTTMNGGTPRNRVAAFDTTTGSLTAWNPNANSPVSSLAVSGSTVYVGGDFASINGSTTRNRLASIDMATGNLTSWDPNANNTVFSLAASGSSIYIGGDFTTINGGTGRNRAAAVDNVNGVFTSWNPNANNTVNALSVIGGAVYLGGYFTTLNGGTTRNYLASVDPTSGAVTSWNPNPNSNVTVLVAAGTTLYAGGYFSSFGATARNYVAAFDTRSGSLTSWSPMPSYRVFSLAVSGNTVYIGGSFSSISGTPRNNLGAVDVTTGNVTSWDPDVDAAVNALAVSGNTLIAGGAFITANGSISRSNLASFDLTTGNLNSWNPGARGNVSTISVSGSTTFVSGAFKSVGNGPGYFAPLDATSGMWLP